MGAVVAIDALLHERRVWRGQPAALPPSAQPTGHAVLDAALPTGGWAEAALSELLIPVDGVGELRLLWPALARLSQAGKRIVLVAPPYIPFAPAGRRRGSNCGSWRWSRRLRRAMRCGPRSSACARAAAARCCAGR